MFDHGRRDRQEGLTLVEILVALVVSLILIAGVIQIFVGTRQTYRFQDALARVQENGRYALERISRDARQAGYAGCSNLLGVTPNLVPPVAAAYSRNDYVAGLANVAAGNPFNAEPGTDVLTLRMLGPSEARVDATVPATGPVTVDANIPGIGLGDTVGIADCNDVDIFRVATVGAGGGGSVSFTVSPPGNLSKAYLEGSILAPFRQVSYFIRDTGRGSLALFLRDADGDAELVDGVDDLWVLYGEDTDNDGTADSYVGADAVANWGRIRSLRVSLLLASNEDNVTGGAQTVTFRGNPVTDSRYKQIITTTVGLRNRLP